jgi:hypothetical protein
VDESTDQRAVDAVLAAAVDIARAAAARDSDDHGVVIDADEPSEAGEIGEHLGVQADGLPGELVATHTFAASVPGYTGWHWAVTVTRSDDDEQRVTVDEVELLPGPNALLAPAWVPWEERVRPGDLTPGDLLPPREDDIRLVPAYTLSGDSAEDDVAFELGLGRERVMSRDGRLLAADRWQTGDRGPDTAMARHAPAACGTCGFFLPLAGSLQAGFGVCGNEATDSDGQVVSVEYGCGAHSQVTAVSHHSEAAEVVYDDDTVETV